jgi:isochorismate hydrolase
MTVVSEFIAEIIEPYPMPDSGELPPNTAPWTLDPRRAVLILLDLQNAALRAFPAGESPLTDLLRNAAALRERCATAGIPVAYTAQPGVMTEEQRGLLKDFWDRSTSLDPAERAIHPAVAPRPGDWVLARKRYSAFHDTSLLWRLRESGRDQLIIAGVYGHIGILTTAVDAFTHDIQPYVVADAIADLTAADHRRTLQYVAARCGVTSTTKQLLTGLPHAGDLP